MRFLIVPVLVVILSPLGCTKDPEQWQAPAPASSAAGPAQAAEIPTERLAGPVIVAAQVGYELGDNGLLIASSPTISSGQPTHALAIFRGPDGASGEAGLQVFADGDALIYSETKPYVLDQGASVAFGGKGPMQKLAAGNYKALFLCDGGPCWEVLFTVE